MTALYPSLLGASWADLAEPVRLIHAGGARARGLFRVTRGKGLLARVLGAILRMPPAADETPVLLAVKHEGEIERWVRTFGERPLPTTQWRSGDLLVESMGLFQCWFRLRAEGGALVFEQVRSTFGFRGFTLPLPRFLSPRVEGRCDPRSGEAQVDIRIHAPVIGLLIAYEGVVAVEQAPALLPKEAAA